MDSKALKSLPMKLRRVADKNGDLRPTSFSKQLDLAFGVSDPRGIESLKRLCCSRPGIFEVKSRKSK